MSLENQRVDQKSLRVITGNKAAWSDVAADCVCFANAAGGSLHIGIEDGQRLPPADQRIDRDLLTRLRKRIGELTVNVDVAPEVMLASNGGEFIVLNILCDLHSASRGHRCNAVPAITRKFLTRCKIIVRLC